MPIEAFVDFDGTITDRDTFDVLVAHFAGEDVLAAGERTLEAGTATLRDVLQQQTSYIRGDFAEVAAFLEREVHVDPSFAAFVARCRASQVPLTVVSSGIEALIRRRLTSMGLSDLPVVANGVIADPAGWHMRFRDRSPNGTDKAALVLRAHDRGAFTLFVGDGHSDFAAALVADRCFARRGYALDGYLRARGIPHETFTSFAEITSALDTVGAAT